MPIPGEEGGACSPPSKLLCRRSGFGLGLMSGLALPSRVHRDGAACPGSVGLQQQKSLLEDGGGCEPVLRTRVERGGPARSWSLGWEVGPWWHRRAGLDSLKREKRDCDHLGLCQGAHPATPPCPQ